MHKRVLLLSLLAFAGLAQAQLNPDEFGEIKASSSAFATHQVLLERVTAQVVGADYQCVATQVLVLPDGTRADTAGEQLASYLSAIGYKVYTHRARAGPVDYVEGVALSENLAVVFRISGYAHRPVYAYCFVVSPSSQDQGRPAQKGYG